MKATTLQRIYLREATVTLFLARIAVRVIPAAMVFAWTNRPPRQIRRFATNEIGWILWAVDAVAAKSDSKTLCLPRALAGHFMLRRRGMTSRVCLGVAREWGNLSAHAWLEVGKDTTAHGPGVGAFTRLAEFGGSS